MTYATQELLDLADRDGDRLEKYKPTSRRFVDQLYGLGQSNMQGGNGDNLSPCTYPAQRVYTIKYDYAELDTTEVTTAPSFGNGQHRVGSTSSMWGFADRWIDLTGRTLALKMLAWQGSPLLQKTPSSIDLHWEVTDDKVAGSLLRSPDLLASPGYEPFDRSAQIPQAITATELRSEWKPGLRICMWSQGEAEAPHMLSGVVSVQDYVDGMQRMWNWLKDNYQMDWFVIMEHGRKGVTELEVSDNEPMNALVRTAQNQFVAENGDVIMGCNGQKDLGSPFNTYTVDGNSVWVSGSQYNDDGVHWEGTFQNAIGRKAAEVLYGYSGL